MFVNFQMWFQNHETLVLYLGVGSITIFVVSIISLPWLLSFIPSNYFITDRDKFSFKGLNLIQIIYKIVWLITRNIIGVILIILGFVMLFLPGPGIVTILVGSFLLSFPAKIKFEQWLIQQSGVLKSINWLRSKNNQPPLRK